jgi:hypothetical protein
MSASHPPGTAFLTGYDRTGDSTGFPGRLELGKALSWLSSQPMPARANVSTAGTRGHVCSLTFCGVRVTHFSGASILERLPATRTTSAVTDWSEQDLDNVLQQVLSNSTRGTCIFIDGLDEIESSDGQLEVLDLVRKLQQIHGTMLCVSSQPEQAFQNGLGHAPSLQLHNLTEQDIRHFVVTTLATYLPSIPSNEYYDSKSLVSEICGGAQGVFLWVRLVLNSLHRGLADDDSLEEIICRVKACPRGLHDLFKEMWTRLGEDQQLYRDEASRYFNLALESNYNYSEAGILFPGINILQMAMAWDDTLKASSMDSEFRLDCEEVRKKCERTKNHVNTRCAGFLECPPEKKEPITASRSEYGSLIPFFKTKVRFIHRSAFDFLRHTREGNEILRYDPSTITERRYSRMRATWPLPIFGHHLSRKPVGPDILIARAHLYGSSLYRDSSMDLKPSPSTRKITTP